MMMMMIRTQERRRRSLASSRRLWGTWTRPEWDRERWFASRSLGCRCSWTAFCCIVHTSTHVHTPPRPPSQLTPKYTASTDASQKDVEHIAEGQSRKPEGHSVERIPSTKSNSRLSLLLNKRRVKHIASVAEYDSALPHLTSRNTVLPGMTRNVNRDWPRNLILTLT